MRFAWSIPNKTTTNEWNWDLRTYDSDGHVQQFNYSSDMVFHDEHGRQIDTSKSEVPEQYLASTYVNPDAVVLELGARYGTVSCVINNRLLNRSKQVSVEPDETVWKALEDNIEKNGCSVHIHKGFVSKKPKKLIHMGYASTTIDGNTETTSLSVEELQRQYNLTFDTLIADCEGFLQTFFDEHPFMYSQLHTVIFEADFPTKCNYDTIRTTLRNAGFKQIIYGFQNVYKK
jgi:FkbM family methyltransferase